MSTVREETGRTRRAWVLLGLAWMGWFGTMYYAMTLHQEVTRLTSLPHLVDHSRRVEQLEDAYNAMRDQRDYWRANAQGRLVTE